MSSFRILIFCTKYVTTSAGSNLAYDLAAALAADGHHVQVVALDWDNNVGAKSRAFRDDNGVDVLSIAPITLRGLGLFIERATKWLCSSVAAMPATLRHLKGERFDLIIAFAPLVTIALPLLWALARFNSRSYVYITDFFPFHQRSLDLVPSGLVFEAARRAEAALIARFDVIGCMSPMNLTYLRSHYRLRQGQRLAILPLWGRIDSPAVVDRAELRRRHGLPTERPIAVFGGLIIIGRGIEEILEAARRARTERPELVFLFVGKGSLESLVRDSIADGAENLFLKSSLARDEYLSLISACDVGLVSTVIGVDVATFPSKTLDYLRAGLPIAASVEPTTDYGAFVQERGFGYAVEAGDPARFLMAIGKILDDPLATEQMRRNGCETLRSVFDAQRAAQNLLHQAFQLDHQ